MDKDEWIFQQEEIKKLRREHDSINSSLGNLNVNEQLERQKIMQVDLKTKSIFPTKSFQQIQEEREAKFTQPWYSTRDKSQDPEYLLTRKSQVESRLGELGVDLEKERRDSYFKY